MRAGFIQFGIVSILLMNQPDFFVQTVHKFFMHALNHSVHKHL